MNYANERHPVRLERLRREAELLVLIGKGFRTCQQVVRRTGWTERNTQRYAQRLDVDGLVHRTQRAALSGNSWEWNYALTDEGKRALADG